MWLMTAPIAAAACSSRADCSHNGECVTGRCNCSAGWIGTTCHQLNFRSGSTSRGLNLWSRTAPYRNTSSWGGAVVRGDDGVYHIYAAIMANHCGLGTYKSNSYVGHATSSDPLSTPFELQDVAVDSYAHEPDAIRDPTTGEYVLLFTAAYRRNGSNWSTPVWGDEAASSPTGVNCSVPAAEQHGFSCVGGKCVNVSSGAQYPSYGDCLKSNKCERIAFPGRYQPACLQWMCWDDPTFMAFSKGPAGPWSTPVIVLDPLPTGDTNLAGVINEDGSFVGLWRAPAPVFDPATGQLRNNEWVSALRPVRASSWRDPSTYWVQPSVDLFPPGAQTTPLALEDPFVWKDGHGAYHALLSDGLFHAISTDGARWSLTPRMSPLDGMRGLPCDGLAGRPHLVFAEDGHTPIALTGRCPLGARPSPH